MEQRGSPAWRCSNTDIKLCAGSVAAQLPQHPHAGITPSDDDAWLCEAKAVNLFALQAKSSEIDFDYVAYAQQRLDEFARLVKAASNDNDS